MIELPGRAERSERIPALDGLRGIAILLVMMFHFAQRVSPLNTIDEIVLGATRIGWMGVDLFFVLSGFLITGILYDTREAKNYFTSFYARRFLRIFPLYYASLTFLLILLPLVGVHVIRLRVARWPWFWLHASNFFVIRQGLPSRYLQHFWSLAIEEQFYLVWPLAVILLRRRWLMVLGAGVIIGSAALRGILYRDGLGVTANYYNTLTRADTLAMGAMIALLLRDPLDARRLRRLAPWMFAVALPAAWLLVAQGTTRPAWSVWTLPAQVVGYSIVAFTFAAALAWSVTRSADFPLNRFLRKRPFRFFGRYSYGIYVIHVPVDTAARALNLHVDTIPTVGGIALPFMLYTVVAGAITVVCALISWNLVEKRFLALKRHFVARKVEAPSPVFVAAKRS